MLELLQFAHADVRGNRGQRPAGAADTRPDWAGQLSRWLDYGALAVGMFRRNGAGA